jgi:probable F420-dependent oxidoreductase
MNNLQIGFMAGGGPRAGIERLEAEPIDSLWTGGHFASRNAGPEAMASLVRLAALTERVRVGTSILLLPLYPPAIVAKQIADLDRATNGRIMLGVGVGGEYAGEFRACEVPLSERGPRTDEAIGLLRRLWSAEEITHEGRFYRLDAVRIHPAPTRPGGPPIIVAGRQPAAMRRAAALGDGWMPYLYSPRRYAESVTTVRQAAADIGRDLAGFAWMVFVFVSVHDDAAVAQEQAARFLGGTYRQDFGAFVDRVAAAGTPDQVAQRLQEYVDAGARHLIIVPCATGDRAAMTNQIVGEIIPRLRVP